MRRPSRTSVLIAAVLLGAIGVGFAWYAYQSRVPDINAVGGTILVYQVDRRGNQNRAVDTTALAESLERRFAYQGLRHVKARPVDAEQVEVLIPRVGDHAAEVQSIKEMVAQVGQLEFRILANGSDDHDAIAAAQSMVNHERDGDAKLKQEFEDAQHDGQPPPGLRDADGQPQKFDLTLARGLKSTVSYSWVELGQVERRTLNLDNAAKDDPQRDAVWREAAANRDKAVRLRGAIGPGGGQAGFLLQGAVFYSRACKDRNLPEQDRIRKEVDYFVLARDPEFDPATGARTAAIDGSFLSSAYADRDATGRPTIAFSLNAAGADLFGALTRKNVAEGVAGGERPKVRHLGIILDGQVMSAPTINSEIRDRGIISGSFTDQQVAQMVSILRAGALPASVLPLPVRETVVEPGHGQ
jgi:SecD/SecF fusion protein